MAVKKFYSFGPWCESPGLFLTWISCRSFRNRKRSSWCAQAGNMLAKWKEMIPNSLLGSDKLELQYPISHFVL